MKNKGTIYILLITIAVFTSLSAFNVEKSGTQDQMVSGKKLYNQWCMACHQADGSGVPGLNPPLTKTDWVNGDKSRLIKLVLSGMNETIVVAGEEYSNPMPAQNHLKDNEIADILTYVRNSFGNKASAVSAADVKTLRSK